MVKNNICIQKTQDKTALIISHLKALKMIKRELFSFKESLERYKFGSGITNANMWQTPYGDANTLVTCGIWGIRPPATLDGPPPYLFQWNEVNQTYEYIFVSYPGKHRVQSMSPDVCS